MKPFTDRLNTGSIFIEPRNRPARFNPQGDLPPRGTGLMTGRAGARRFGKPRTDAERRLRHFGQRMSMIFIKRPGIKNRIRSFRR